MLPKFLRRWIDERDSKERDSRSSSDDPEPSPKDKSSFFVEEFAAGRVEALDEIVRRYHGIMLATARRLSRRYRVQGVLVESDDAVSGTLLRLLSDAREGRVGSMSDSTRF